MSETKSFKTRARIINQLGEQLIRNEYIALLELVKNSYDADASTCSVEMANIETTDSGQIIITDNGTGMDRGILENAWLEIGTSYKEDMGRDKKTIKSSYFKRIPIGEKGIGRLGVHKLGKKIKIITRMKDKPEYILDIDWKQVENSKYIEDLPVNIAEKNPNEFKNSSGTKIIITELKTQWTKRLAREAYRAIMSLNSPFKSHDSFHVNLTINNDWLEGLLTYEDIKQYSLFSFRVTMEGKMITEFKYKFTPWPTMEKLEHKNIYLSDIGKLVRMVRKENGNLIDIDLEKYNIGHLVFEGLIFDRDSKILNLQIEDKAGFKKYLSQNGGVRVYRDNMRVMDYGEPGNDWLDLEGRRINVPAKRISKNILMAAIYLERDKSTDLKEKANREGFVENEAYNEMWYAVRYAIHLVESYRKIDKDLIRRYYGDYKTSEPLTNTLSELKEVIEKKISDQDIKKNIMGYIDRIEGEYERITETLFKSAGAGLNLSMIIHQIEKIIKEIKSMLLGNASSEIITSRVDNLAKLVDGYSVLIRSSELKARDLAEITDQAIFNIDFRLNAHNIKLINRYKQNKNNIKAICAENHVVIALMNIFDNSIFWLSYSGTKNPFIFVDISEEIDGYVTIIVGDNGPGFASSPDELVEPFVSFKPGGSGIGLALTSEIMKSLKGKLIFDVEEYFEIPHDYKKGALLGLAFKEGKDV